jgi:hypothetical protein
MSGASLGAATGRRECDGFPARNCPIWFFCSRLALASDCVHKVQQRRRRQHPAHKPVGQGEAWRSVQPQAGGEGPVFLEDAGDLGSVHLRLDRCHVEPHVGADADWIAFDPDAVSALDPATLLHRHKLTPYAGRRLTGQVMHTALRGETVWREGAIVGAPRGRALLGRCA